MRPSLGLVVLTSLIKAGASRGAVYLPHGLVPAQLEGRSRTVHNMVLRAQGNDEMAQRACADRLEELRRLLANDELREVVELSYALPNHMRENLPANCSVDLPQTGFADITSIVTTPLKHNARARSSQSSLIRLNDVDFMPLVDSAGRQLGSGRSIPVAGTEIDGHFVLAESPVRCSFADYQSLSCDGAGHSDQQFSNVESALAHVGRIWSTVHTEPHDKLGTDVVLANVSSGNPTLASVDKETDYAIGQKSILIIPVCANNYAPNCSNRFNYNLLQNSDIKSYMETVVEKANRYFDRNSYGQFSIAATILDPMSIAYQQNKCKNIGSSIPALTRWNGMYATAIDTMAHNAAMNAGFNYEDYDFSMVVLDKCNKLSISGLGYKGYPGALLNLRAGNYDPSFVHELGEAPGTHMRTERNLLCSCRSQLWC